MSNYTIKKYIWETEPNACKKCQILNGMEYKIPEEIPDRPHPNCKCHIREVYEAGCDCWELIDDLEKLLSDISGLKDEIEKELNSIDEIIYQYFKFDYADIHRVLNDIESLKHPYRTLSNTVYEFWNNYETMKNVNVINADKYYHAKANCQASQNGILGSAIAKGISDLREYTDDYRNINEKKYTLEESLKDILEDQEANREGRSLGRRYPKDNCSELLKHRIPKGLEKKDW